MATAPHTKTRYNDIKDVTLVDFLDVETEQTLAAHEIWKDQPTVVIGMKSEGGMKMVCIVHEKEGANIFQKEFWHGKVFFDTEKGFYQALGGGRLRTGGWEQLIRPTFWVNLVRNKRSGVQGNFEGDGSILGGLLIVNANEGGIAYEHIEEVWGDIAGADKVLAACSRVSDVPLSKDTAAKAHQDHVTLHQRMQQSSYATSGGVCAPASVSGSGPVSTTAA
ncbi:hypothetical protein BGZ65_000582 [Modicella reniformis]|uniref:Peroxiredoxin-like 2A n=1 Tax=Modicella reniformis TaxID=1440133 RepID=A0A9P6MJF3_9FUNG|nr:hypothetical protein BGZ65_000582 [Modicella reniformis]